MVQQIQHILIHFIHIGNNIFLIKYAVRIKNTTFIPNIIYLELLFFTIDDTIFTNT